MERRVEIRKPIICRMECSDGQKSFSAEGFDMSETGVSFACRQDLRPDTEVTLNYRLQVNGPMVSARVLIRQQSGGRYGAKFLDRKVALVQS
jgi:hypothetical protein